MSKLYLIYINNFFARKNTTKCAIDLFMKKTLIDQMSFKHIQYNICLSLSIL